MASKFAPSVLSCGRAGIHPRQKNAREARYLCATPLAATLPLRNPRARPQSARPALRARLHLRYFGSNSCRTL